MSELTSTGTGIIYQNPRAHVRSEHAYFPSVVLLDNGDMLASVVLGEAFEAVNLHTHILRSTDQGETWRHEGQIYPGTPDRITSDSARITALPNGEVAAFIVRHDRTDHPEEGLTNPETMGFVPTELMIARSEDYGRTWSEPEVFTPPIVGPCFELCCPVTPLTNGKWLLPLSTWRGWDGFCPNGMKMIALISHDRGATWPGYMDVMDGSKDGTIYWESKIVEMPDGRLLVTAWAYNEPSASDLPNQYAVSRDGGKLWTEPRSTGLIGQTLTPFVMKDGRVLSVYRRVDHPGLWANISRLDGDDWVNESLTPIWGCETQGLTEHSANMSQNFNVLRFGAPCVTALPDGSIFVAFWCYEGCISVIRWFKLSLPFC